MRTAPAIGKTDDNDLFHVGSGVLQFWTLDRTAQSVRRAIATVAVKAKAQAIIKFRISPPSKWLPEPVPAVPLLLVMERGGNAIRMGGQGPRLCALGHITAADPSLVFRCSISGGSIMQQTSSRGQAQRSRKNSVLVPGLGAAFVASAVHCVVMTSPVTAWRKVFDNVNGVVAFQGNWMPLKGC